MASLGLRREVSWHENWQQVVDDEIGPYGQPTEFSEELGLGSDDIGLEIQAEEDVAWAGFHDGGGPDELWRSSRRIGEQRMTVAPPVWCRIDRDHLRARQLAR